VLPWSDGFVLPRWLRRPVRMIGRLGTGNFTPPRYAATMATAVLFSATGLYGAWLGGHLPATVQAVTARTGFAVDQVRMVGHHETSEIDILERLELDGWTSLIGFNADAARDRVAGLPWIETASVRKIYPDAIEIRVVERKPFAIWQHGSELSIIGRAGNVIAPFTGGRSDNLPLVVGYGAAESAAGFVARVARMPDLARKVKGYIRVAGRRWDLRLDNDITVKLPETGEDAAIAELMRLDRDNSLLSRDIAAVDMRFADRLVVKLTPGAAEARQASLAEQAKKAKRRPEKRA
jgi:cell division protein FtsQ